MRTLSSDQTSNNEVHTNYGIDHPRILVVGAGTPNADFVAQVLTDNGFAADWTDQLRFPNPRILRKCDVIYGIYLQSCSRNILVGKLLGKKTIVHFVGSDAYWYAREQSLWRRLYWNLTLRLTDLVLYVSPHLTEFVGRNGVVLPFPIETDEFKQTSLREIEPERDVLYYCPSGEANQRIYQLSWIIDYAKSHPEQKITVIGNQSHPAHYKIQLPNVQVIPFVPQSEMPVLYRKHKRLVRMTLEDGLPRMVHEALLAGIEVIYNRDRVLEVPPERDPRQFSLSFAKALNAILPSR
jgi:hypothetical protein